MRTATYKLVSGEIKTIEYNENAPCIVCGEPIVEASVGGTNVCPWCDMGKCRYCGVDLPFDFTLERRNKRIREHITWHKKDIEEIK